MFEKETGKNQRWDVILNLKWVNQQMHKMKRKKNFFSRNGFENLNI